jgi:hypothetical protein
MVGLDLLAGKVPGPQLRLAGLARFCNCSGRGDRANWLSR